MERDGSAKSIWQDDITDFTPTNSWQPDKVYDVLIVGGGITGLTAALLLQESGKECILAEARNIGFGTSGGTTAHLNTSLDTPYKQVAKDFSKDAAIHLANGAKNAISTIEKLSERYQIECGFAYKPAYVFAETEEEAKDLETILDGNNSVGVATEWCDHIPLSIPFVKAIKIASQAQLHATKYLAGLALAFEKAGGVIVHDCHVKSIFGDESVEAETSLGTIKAVRAVYATHIPPGMNIFSFRCAPYRSYAMAFTLKTGDYPDALIYDCKDPYNYYRTLEANGNRYIVAGGFDHKTGHNDNAKYTFSELEANARGCFDIEEIAYKWSSQYYVPVDGLPYIGLMPGHENIYIATGFGGNGMTLGTLAGKVISDMINGVETPYEELFDPSRIKMIAGFASFVKEGADVISQYAGKRLSSKKITGLPDLAKGEATVAKWDGQRIGLHKDESGRVYAIDPVCPHAGCIVGWNNAEKTWDCPCHGARYAPDGTLITGPAQKGLQKIVIEDNEEGESQ